jgi:intergrase/recombinase
VPAEESIGKSLSSLCKAPRKYRVLYDLLLDSGLRLVEAVKVINGFKAESAERVGRFYRVEVAMFRGSKQTFYCYLTELTLKAISESSIERLGAVAASRYYTKMGYIQPKYLRKFAFDSIIGLEVPESVADFIEGRVPKRVGAKHYCVLRRQADRFHGKYSKYVEDLRRAL